VYKWKLAGVLILDKNLLRVPAEELKNIVVLGTTKEVEITLPERT